MLLQCHEIGIAGQPTASPRRQRRRARRSPPSWLTAPSPTSTERPSRLIKVPKTAGAAARSSE